jgi:hypothetical protein
VTNSRPGRLNPRERADLAAPENASLAILTLRQLGARMLSFATTETVVMRLLRWLGYDPERAGHRRILKKYATYYNELRTHRSLNKDAPIHRGLQHVGRIVSAPILGGLHHHYCRI